MSLFGHVAIADGGTLFAVTVGGWSDPTVPKTYARGEITGFSRKSRTRLFCRLNAVEERHWRDCRVITLTYHENITDGPRAKRDLNVFLQWIRDNYPKCAYVWKAENQQRGAIHFHLLLWGSGYIRKERISSVWTRIVDPGNLDHLAAGTQIRKLRNPARNRRYLCKYMSKIDSGLGGNDAETYGEVGGSEEQPGGAEGDSKEAAGMDGDSSGIDGSGHPGRIGRVWATSRGFALLLAPISGIRVPFVVARFLQGCVCSLWNSRFGALPKGEGFTPSTVYLYLGTAEACRASLEQIAGKWARPREKIYPERQWWDFAEEPQLTSEDRSELYQIVLTLLNRQSHEKNTSTSKAGANQKKKVGDKGIC